VSEDTIKTQETVVAPQAFSVGAFFRRIGQTIASPVEAFSAPCSGWEWPLAVLLSGLISFSLFQIQKPYALPEMRAAAVETLEKYKDQMPAESYEEALAGMEKGFAQAQSVSFLTYIQTLGGILAFALVIALMGWMAGNFFFGGSAPFWKLLTVAAFSVFASLIGDIIHTLLVMQKETSYVYVGLGVLHPMNDKSFLYYFLRQIELGAIWRLAVVCVGCAAIYKMTAGKFAFVLAPLWLIFIAIVAALNIFTGGTIVY